MTLSYLRETVLYTTLLYVPEIDLYIKGIHRKTDDFNAYALTLYFQYGQEPDTTECQDVMRFRHHAGLCIDKLDSSLVFYSCDDSEGRIVNERSFKFKPVRIKSGYLSLSGSLDTLNAFRDRIQCAIEYWKESSIVVYGQSLYGKVHRHSCEPETRFQRWKSEIFKR